MYLIQPTQVTVFLPPILGSYLGKVTAFFFHYSWEIIHKIGENKAIFGLGMSPVTGHFHVKLEKQKLGMSV